MREVEFNLLDEPWVRVLMPDCTVREVSLTDALLHANEYTGLAGELPTQDAAILRLLLAVLHTVFSRVDAEGREMELTSADGALLRWRSLWQLGHFPEEPICAYLDQWHERFWLFHPERPFWQVPKAKIGTEYSAAKLNGEISESGNKPRIFSAYTGTGKAEMTYAQAARWLLYINGFDDTSAKPKGKGLPSVGTGWLGKLGLIFAQGGTLFETLMFNFVLLRDGASLWGSPVPCWELPEARSTERTEIPQPDDAASLLTLQSRRILLHREPGAVTGYALLGGDFFQRENAFCEQMTLWRGRQENKNTPIVYLPRRHDSAKQFWREFPTVFLQQSGGRQPGLIRWIARLQTSNILSRKKMICFRITGVGYGDKDFFATDTFSDSLSFHMQLLDELGKTWRQRITDEIEFCEKLAMAVGRLAEALTIAAGDADERQQSEAAKTAREQFYFRLDRPFRDWLQEIDPEWDGEKTEQNILAWRDRAQTLAQPFGRELVQETGVSAFTGRTVIRNPGKTTEKKYFYSAPKAYNWFLIEIAKIYPTHRKVE